MAHAVFSDDWARACAEELNTREGYRQAGADWEGSVVLLMTADSAAGSREERRVLLDLWRGVCREARVASRADEEPARYVMAGAPDTWRRVLTGGLAPVMALITGKLTLTKGSLVELLPHVALARELVAAACAVDTVFPIED
jgi:putative sterol carrier protein